MTESFAAALEESTRCEHQVDFLAGLFLAGTLVMSTSLDYLWYGPLPAWLIVGLAGLAVSTLLPKHRSAMVRVFRYAGLSIILPWLVFILLVSGLDATKGLIEESFSKRVLLSSSTLLLMMVTAVWASRVRPAVVLYILAVIIAAQGIVCIAQYSNVDFAWNLPETILEKSGARADKVTLYDIEFKDVGRVRGTNPLVHKFNSMQGVASVFLLAVLILNLQFGNPLRVRMALLVPLTLCGSVGMVLTFSRSTIFGTVVALLVILLNIRKVGTVWILVFASGFIYLGAEQLGIREAKQFNRVTDFSLTRATNASRLAQYSYALNEIAENPLMGKPEGSSTDRLLVHSVILRLMTDYGLIGTLPYLLVLCNLTLFFFRNRTKSGHYTKTLALASMCSLCVGILDAWSHSSGIMVRDVAQPAMYGAFWGAMLGQLTPSVPPPRVRDIHSSQEAFLHSAVQQQ